MIFLKRDQTDIKIPKHQVRRVENPEPALTLYLTHKMTGTKYDFNQLTDIGHNTGYWIFNNMDFSTLQSGEYEYFLTSDILDPLEVGLLQVIKTDVTDVTTYKKEQNTVIYNG